MPTFPKIIAWARTPCYIILYILSPLLVPPYYLIQSMRDDWRRPDFETSLITGHKLPVLGMPLCWRCKVLKYKFWSSRLSHYDDYSSLVKSANSGCWCCTTIVSQFDAALQDADNPLLLLAPNDLKVPELLMWFANVTETKTGFLDSFRSINYHEFVFGEAPRLISHDPASDANFELIQRWIGACNLGHQCFQNQTEHHWSYSRLPRLPECIHSLPTRVIDVSLDQPRIMISKDLQAHYVTLSHCWGKAQPLTTTISTLAERLAGIEMNSLPQMFQDAILITRKLGIRYLWIDSLCIIQDSEVDWAQEAAKMGEVYRHAYVTISVLDAKDCHQAILLKRLTTHDEDSEVAERIMNSPLKKQAEIFRAAILSKRAWALQERLLSPRILHYSTGEMWWECLAVTAREGSQKLKEYRPSPYSYQRYQCADVKNRLIKPAGSKPSLPLSPPTDWHIIVAEYTRCYLTKASDKLPAISGLASIFRDNTGYTYLAGLWKEDFRDCLLWYIRQEEHQQTRHSNESYRGPSWSWVSSNLPVLYVTIAGHEDYTAKTWNDLETYPKLLNSDIELASANAMGEIIDAKITVSAHIREFWYDTPSQSSSFVYDSDGVKCGTVFLDTLDNEPESRKSCMGLLVAKREATNIDYDGDFSRAFHTSRWTYFLLIVPDTINIGSWRRIGLGRSFCNTEIFSRDSKMTDVLLI